MSTNTVTTMRVRILMERSFDSFAADNRNQFLLDLATLLGCTVDEISSVRFSRGCVYFDGRVPRQAALRLDELNSRRADFPSAPEMHALGEFIERYNITSITIGPGHNLKILQSKRTASGGRDLLFVHGWRGDEMSFALLPEWLSDEFKCRSLVYPYPTGIAKHSPSLVFLSRHLDNWLRDRQPADTLAIIAHSYGGLVSRKFTVIQETRMDGLDRSLVALLLVASPSHGTELARAGKHLPGLGSEQVRELSTDSVVLFELNEAWQNWVRNNGDRVAVRSIFGTADPYVPVNSAQGLDPQAIPIPGATHEDIIRPSLRTDGIVTTLSRLLRESGFGTGDRRGIAQDRMGERKA